MRRGGGKGSISRTLITHIKACSNSLSAEQLARHLRATYPTYYSRQKERPFIKHIERVLHQVQSDAAEREEENSRTPPRKKPRRIDDDEARLQLIEASHIANRRKIQSGSSGSSTSDDGSGASSSEEEEEGVSTSEDAIYEKKIDTKNDYFKDMLRDSYLSNSATKASEKKDVRMKDVVKELEVEHSNDGKKKGSKKVDALKERGKRMFVFEDTERTTGEGKDVDKAGKSGDGSDGPRFKDLGGLREVVEELKMEVIVPLYHPQLPRYLGVKPMAGILFHGPPGCGKTKLAHAIANETGLPFYKISATELVSGISGASEENIRELFSKAYRTAPSIVFIDEIDAIASKRENLQREMERRIVTQLMTCMDQSNRLVQPNSEDINSDSSADSSRPGYVLVIGATNRPDAVDPALRRPGRFDREIVLGVPDEKARIEILSVLTRNLKVEGTFDLVKIARSTPGFVGADLAALTNKAGNLAMQRIIDRRKVELSKETANDESAADWWRQPWTPEEMEKLRITMADFEEAAKVVQPSSRREGFSAIPDVKWQDVGGLHLLRLEFDRYIVRRIKYPADYEDFGVDLETGFLLYGPPGCGKTLIAKAVANEAGANFIHIKGPELLNKYVGESELAVRTIFSRARTCSPCIVFFDEVDALTTKRGKEGGWVVERLLNQLLIELDGAEQRKGVYVIGATNRPEVMDRAVLRPGRFGKLLYVPLPSPDERGLILKALCKKKPIDANVDLMAIGRDSSCENLSGADLSALMNDAAMAALDDKVNLLATGCSDGALATIKEVHFKRALEKISPSVSDKQKQYYQQLSESFRAV